MSSIENSDKLTAITCINDLQELQNLYRQNWPEHCVGFYTLDNFIRWLKKEPELKNLNIYTLNDDYRRDGLFLIVDRYQLFVNVLCPAGNNESNSDELNRHHIVRLAKAISLLNWTTGFKVSSFLDRHRSAVVKVVRELNLRPEYDSLTLLYFLPADEASRLDISCKPGYVLRPLSLSDATIVNDHWPNRHQGSLFLLQRLIAWNISMGVYVESSNELVAWCVRLQGGFLGALQVKDSHKRLGLGSLVTRGIARRLACELGHDVMALVGEENIPSRGLFEKLGFKVTDKAHWLRTFPTIEKYEWTDE